MAEIVSIRRTEPSEPLVADQVGGILRLTMGNPPANVLSLAMIAALQAALDSARDDVSVRVVVIASRGKVFSAGHDLKEMTAHRSDVDGGRAFFERTFSACSTLMQSIVALQKPVIAEVDGIATAAGCQLVATCDLAITSDESRFGVNGIDVGLFCTTPGVALARGLKPKHAMEMLLTGEMVDASSAREFGLVNRVVPRQYLAQVVNKYAQTIADKSPTSIRAGKEAFYRQAQMSLPDAYEYASRVIVENMLAPDAREGIDAFFEKRKPHWRDE